MDALAAISSATRRLSTLLSLGSRFRSSECFLGQRSRALSQAAEAQRGTRIYGGLRAAEAQSGTRIYGDPLKQRQHLPCLFEPWRAFPSDYDRSVSSVLERKCSTPLQHLTSNFSLKPKPTPDIFVPHIDVDNCPYFTAYSLEEDGTLLRKYDIYPPVGNLDTMSSCNGLFLFLKGAKELLLWNPTTNEFKILPQPYDELPPIERHYHAFQMWYDHGSKDYKVLIVVMVVELDDEGERIGITYDIALYSLKANSWKIIPCTGLSCFETVGVCVIGFYYTLATLAYDKSRLVTISFDIATTTLSSITLPNMSKSDVCELIEYNGLLGLLVYSRDELERNYGIWVMSDGSWSKETVFHTCGVRQLEWFSENGERLYFQNLNDELLVFDRATGKSKPLGVYGVDGSIWLMPFYESFAQLKGDGVSDVEVKLLS